MDFIEDKQYQFLKHIDMIHWLFVGKFMKGTLTHKSGIDRFELKNFILSKIRYEYLDHLCLPAGGVTFCRMNSTMMNSVRMNSVVMNNIVVNSVDRHDMNSVDRAG